jgi:GntR family transcriptional regulator
MDLDEHSDEPLWRQVLDDLEARLASGEIGDRFPTDRELVEHYGVSRHTVREAVRRLTARGVVDRVRGRGSVVTQREFVEPFGTLYSLFRAVETGGVEQRSEVLALGWRSDDHAATRLGLEPGSRMVELQRLRLAGGRPLALDTTWLPPDLGEPLLGVDFTRTALYDELEQRVGFRPTEGEEVIAAVLPDAGVRELLAMDDDEALLRIERLGVHEGRTVECRLTLVRGSRFALASRWPSDARVEPRIDVGGAPG